MNTEEEDFKAKYNAMLNEFKELKAKDKLNEPRCKQLAAEIASIDTKNKDMQIQIKILQAELSTASEAEVAQALQEDYKAKIDKLAQLEAQSNFTQDFTLFSKKTQIVDKNRQKLGKNEAIIEKITATLNDKLAHLKEKEQEYKNIVEETNALSNNSDYQRKELAKAMEALQLQNSELDKELNDIIGARFATSSHEAADQQLIDLENLIRIAEEQQKSIQTGIEAQINAIELELAEPNKIDAEVRSQYQSSFDELALTKQKIQDDIVNLGKQRAAREQSELDRLNQKIRQTVEGIQNQKTIKENLEKAIGELTIKKKQDQAEKAKVAAKSSKIQAVSAQIKDIQGQIKEVHAAIQAAKEKNTGLRREKDLTVQKVAEIKAKHLKVDLKELEKARGQKEGLEKELAREKERYESLKELQKTYHPESVLKECKAEYDELKKKTVNYPNLVSLNKRLNDQSTKLTQSLDELRKQEQEITRSLHAELAEARERLAEAEAQHKECTRQLTESTNKLNSYLKAYPNHEEEKLQRKKQEKRLQEEAARERRFQQKRATAEQQRLTQELEDYVVMPVISQPEPKKDLLREYGLTGIVVALIAVLLAIGMSR